MLSNYKKYTKESDYSYTLGVYSTIELLKRKKEQVIGVVFSTDSAANQGRKVAEDLCVRNKIPFEINDSLVSKLSLKDNTYAVGIFRKYTSELSPSANHLVLVNPSDTGNIGTITRTMLGFNFKNMAIIKPAVDIFDPKTIRASQGALFGVNFAYFNTFEEYKEIFNRVMYNFMTNGEISLAKLKPVKPCSLVFGNESSGLPPSFLNHGTSVQIDQTSEIDSLNLSIAAGIALHKMFSENR